MQKLFSDTRILDQDTRIRFNMTEEIMMENAASGLEQEVRSIIENKTVPGTVLILCGGGNNGADGYALARRLSGSVYAKNEPVYAYRAISPQSSLCKIQADRAEKAGVIIYESSDGSLPSLVPHPAVLVDCIFGSGFHGSLDEKMTRLLAQTNAGDWYRIACDVPTGLASDGTISGSVFYADTTVTMGALKTCLYSDAAKDAVGNIVCVPLGISRFLYENTGIHSDALLLESSDLLLPHRTKKSVHKGSFGHVVIAEGEKTGAAVIAGAAALRFGAGLVTLVHCGALEQPVDQCAVPPELMHAESFPSTTTAAAFGMGLGRNPAAAVPYIKWLSEHASVPCVIDADACYAPDLKELLQKRKTGVVLTPHPKEFQSLLSVCGLGTFSITDCVNQRLMLVDRFCRAFPGSVLLVKGANPVIGYFSGETEQKTQLFINPLGNPCLAKAGSGDVLSGLIGALLAQQREPLEAAIQGSLAHTIASQHIHSDYAMTPFSLIEKVACL